MSIDHFKPIINRLSTGRAWRGPGQRAILKVIADMIQIISDELIEISKIKLVLGGVVTDETMQLNDDLHTLGSTFAMLGDQTSNSGELSIWEIILDLLGLGTDDERLQAIISALISSGSISLLAVQTSLLEAGFDVYLHANSSTGGTVSPITYGTINVYGGLVGSGPDVLQYAAQSTVVNPDFSNTEVCVNYVDAVKDESKYRTNFTNDSRRWEYAFFIGGAGWLSRSNVAIARKDEFRELILRLKPAGMWAVLLIDYV